MCINIPNFKRFGFSTKILERNSIIWQNFGFWINIRLIAHFWPDKCLCGAPWSEWGCITAPRNHESGGAWDLLRYQLGWVSVRPSLSALFPLSQESSETRGNTIFWQENKTPQGLYAGKIRKFYEKNFGSKNFNLPFFHCNLTVKFGCSQGGPLGFWGSKNSNFSRCPKMTCKCAGPIERVKKWCSLHF